MSTIKERLAALAAASGGQAPSETAAAQKLAAAKPLNARLATLGVKPDERTKPGAAARAPAGKAAHAGWVKKQGTGIMAASFMTRWCQLYADPPLLRFFVDQAATQHKGDYELAGVAATASGEVVHLKPSKAGQSATKLKLPTPAEADGWAAQLAMFGPTPPPSPTAAMPASKPSTPSESSLGKAVNPQTSNMAAQLAPLSDGSSTSSATSGSSTSSVSSQKWLADNVGADWGAVTKPKRPSMMSAELGGAGPVELGTPTSYRGPDSRTAMPRTGRSLQPGSLTPLQIDEERDAARPPIEDSSGLPGELASVSDEEEEEDAPPQQVANLTTPRKGGEARPSLLARIGSSIGGAMRRMSSGAAATPPPPTTTPTTAPTEAVIDEQAIDDLATQVVREMIDAALVECGLGAQVVRETIDAALADVSAPIDLAAHVIENSLASDAAAQGGPEPTFVDARMTIDGDKVRFDYTLSDGRVINSFRHAPALEAAQPEFSHANFRIGDGGMLHFAYTFVRPAPPPHTHTDALPACVCHTKNMYCTYHNGGIWSSSLYVTLWL